MENGIKNNAQKLDELICWAEFYGNSRKLAVPTMFNEIKFNKVQDQILSLKRKLFGR